MAQNVFNSVQVKAPPRSKFDMSHSHRLSLKMGRLIPFMFEECLPGDYWDIRTESLIRFAPLVTPVMEQFDVNLDYYFVPYRLLWEGFEQWIVGEYDSLPPHAVTGTDLNSVPFTLGSVADYLGLNVAAEYWESDDSQVNAFGFLAYQKIWFDWFRDQNHQNPDDRWEIDWQIKKGDEFLSNMNVNHAKYFSMRRRAWYHDYFTSALPWAQKGDQVVIPFGEFDDVPIATTPNQPQYLYEMDGDPTAGVVTLIADVQSRLARGDNGDDLWLNVQGTALTSGLTVGAASIDELNKAYKIQAWLQRNARAGTRYVEHVLAHFGEKTRDYRLARAEYLGGQRMPVIISEVLQTSGANTIDDNGNLGDMAGRGITASGGKGIGYKVHEHGCIMGIMSVMSRAAYYQGVDKKFWRKDKFDYATPLLAQIGEQPIEYREIYHFNLETGKQTFGYTPRYSDWKYSKNQISGDFKTDLDDWHYARKFQMQPALNASFLTWSGDNRIFAVEDDIDNVYAQLNIIATASRPLPFYGTPTI